jgi:hypothetical protein
MQREKENRKYVSNKLNKQDCDQLNLSIIIFRYSSLQLK